MKLLLVHRYIRPDTPGYAHMLYIMGQRFAAEGHDVTIFSCQPGYNNVYDGPALPKREQVDGMTVIRVPLLKESKSKPLVRAINFVWFALRVIMHSVLRGRAYDLMTVTTFPPTLMAAVARFVCLFRKTEYIYHCMDLYPEIAQTSGMLNRSLPLRFAAWVDRRNCEKAKAVVVLSDDMLKSLQKRGLSGDNVHVINNFIINEVDESAEVPEAFGNPSDTFRVLFAGNIGRFQSLETIVDAAKVLENNREIEFWFIGAGVSVDSLKEQAGSLLDRSVFFNPYLPIESAMKVIHRSHLGVVSLAPTVIHCAYPSKTMSYLEAGCKLLCLVEDDSSLASLVEVNQLGVVCSQPATAESVAASISDQFETWKNEGYDRESIQEVGRSHFGQAVLLECWLRLIQGESPWPSSQATTSNAETAVKKQTPLHAHSTD
jgi:glycosyltransferase involved in cell wall biosynthesis